MANSEKIIVHLPSSIIEEADHLAKIENMDRNEFLTKIIRSYLQEKCFGENLLRLKEGYEEMASINTALAELGMSIDLPSLEEYEGKISESD
jgi:CopG family transcriptional regulator / antitoxin EndoAI